MKTDIVLFYFMFCLIHLSFNFLYSANLRYLVFYYINNIYFLENNRVEVIFKNRNIFKFFFVCLF